MNPVLYEFCPSKEDKDKIESMKKAKATFARLKSKRKKKK